MEVNEDFEYRTNLNHDCAVGFEKGLSVCHVMRTYGKNGGEKQLAQMLGQSQGEVEEHFAFLYRDALCESLFNASSQHIKCHRLWPFSIKPRYSPWFELLILLPLLPVMQIRLFILLLTSRSRACIVHGFQAALVAWPSAMLLRNIGFGYFHRITKSSTGKNPLFRLIYRPYRRLAGVSHAVKDSLAGLAPYSKLIAVENGVDIDRIRNAANTTAPAKTEVIISIARLLPHKGHLFIIEMFAQHIVAFPNTELWIVGDGESKNDLEAAIARLNLKGRVNLLGRREDIPQLLGAATVFVHASDWEGMSNSVLEAMTVGVPSVVVDAPGVTECHENGVTGFVVSRNAQEMGERIASLLRDPDLRQKMSHAARLRVDAKYSIRANRQKYLNLYRELAEDRRVGS